MAPDWVQTYAEVWTARLCASFMEQPFRIDDTNAAVNESPAPTVSSTFTAGVGRNEMLPGVKT